MGAGLGVDSREEPGRAKGVADVRRGRRRERRRRGGREVRVGGLGWCMVDGGRSAGGAGMEVGRRGEGCGGVRGVREWGVGRRGEMGWWEERGYG